MTDPIPGTIREDGFMFIKMNTHKNGKAYPLWLSPASVQKQRERVRNWRLNNLDYSRQLVREWREKRKKARKASKSTDEAPDQVGSRKSKESVQEAPKRSKKSHSSSGITSQKCDSKNPVSSSSSSKNEKWNQSQNGTCPGSSSISSILGTPLKGGIPKKMEPQWNHERDRGSSISKIGTKPQKIKKVIKNK